jgi:manganese oxidase
VWNIFILSEVCTGNAGILQPFLINIGADMKKHNFIYRRLILLSGFIMIAGMIGCKSDSGTNSTNPTTPQGGSNTIAMQNTAFVPATLTVTAGTTVTWTNNDAIVHTVTSGTPSAPDGMFDSGNLNQGGTFHFTFSTKGTFQYFCRVHPTMMKATITVQ